MISASAPRSVSDPYRRYLLNAFRKELPFREVPIRLYVRGRGTGDKSGGTSAAASAGDTDDGAGE